jgi:hypothetical protein
MTTGGYTESYLHYDGDGVFIGEEISKSPFHNDGYYYHANLYFNSESGYTIKRFDRKATESEVRKAKLKILGI